MCCVTVSGTDSYELQLMQQTAADCQSTTAYVRSEYHCFSVYLWLS